MGFWKNFFPCYLTFSLAWYTKVCYWPTCTYAWPCNLPAPITLLIALRAPCVLYIYYKSCNIYYSWIFTHLFKAYEIFTINNKISILESVLIGLIGVVRIAVGMLQVYISKWMSIVFIYSGSYRKLPEQHMYFLIW